MGRDKGEPPGPKCGCWCHRLVVPKLECSVETCGKSGCRIPQAHVPRKVVGGEDYWLRVTHPDYVAEPPAPPKEKRKSRVSKVAKAAAAAAKLKAAAGAAAPPAGAAADAAAAAGAAAAAPPAPAAPAARAGRSAMPKLPLDALGGAPAGRSMLPNHEPGAPVARKPPPSPRPGDGDAATPADAAPPPPGPPPPPQPAAAADKPPDRSKPVFRSI